MTYPSSIYNLLHQELKACADHLFEMFHLPSHILEDQSEHILCRLRELQKSSEKVCLKTHYHPLTELKHHLENTTIAYEDASNQLQSIPLSEALCFLTEIQQGNCHLEPVVKTSLLKQCMNHIYNEMQPGHSIHRVLGEIKAL